MSIVDYASLQTSIADWLLRTDLTAVIPTFIQNAEAKFRRDPRVRRLTVQPLIVSTGEVSLPATFKALDSLSYAAGPHCGELQVVRVADLRQGEAVGPPTRCAVSPQPGAGGTLYVAPTPDDTYTMRLSFWETVPHLGGAVLSNWLLAAHPDLYLYGCLLESAPYIREDERMTLWQTERETKLEELHMAVQDTTYAGPLSRTPRGF